jgi:hypothetical protein
MVIKARRYHEETHNPKYVSILHNYLIFLVNLWDHPLGMKRKLVAPVVNLLVDLLLYAFSCVLRLKDNGPGIPVTNFRELAAALGGEGPIGDQIQDSSLTIYEPVPFGGGPQSSTSSISAPVARSNSQSPQMILSGVTSVTVRLSLSSPAK